MTEQRDSLPAGELLRSAETFPCSRRQDDAGYSAVYAANRVARGQLPRDDRPHPRRRQESVSYLHEIGQGDFVGSSEQDAHLGTLGEGWAVAGLSGRPTAGIPATGTTTSTQAGTTGS